MAQQEFTFKDRDKLISDLCLPKTMDTRHGSVSLRIVRAVLWRLNQHLGMHAETWISQERIAEQTEYSLRSVKRAMAALRARGLVQVERKKSLSGVVCNHYAIDWYRIGLLNQTQRHPETRPDQSAMGADQSAMGADQSATSGTQHIHRQSKDRQNNSMEANGDGVLEICGEENSSFTLRRDLTIEDLRDVETVEQLWHRALSLRKLKASDEHQLLFFALCHLTVRKAQHRSLRNPIGFMHQLLRRGAIAIACQVDDEHDIAWAKRAVRTLRRDPVLSQQQRPRADPGLLQSQQAREEAQLLAENQRRLQEAFPMIKHEANKGYEG